MKLQKDDRIQPFINFRCLYQYMRGYTFQPNDDAKYSPDENNETEIQLAKIPLMTFRTKMEITVVRS